jgi:hypothetical protein
VKRSGKSILALVVTLGVAVCAILAVSLLRGGLGKASLLAGVLGIPLAAIATIAAVVAVIPRRLKPADPLDAIADDLAEAVELQWEREAKRRQLDEPGALAVSWTAAGDDDDLFELWPGLADGSVDNWPGERQGADPGRAAEPGDLAGSGDEICDTLARVPTGRLVVLGEPGAGKTMLLLSLVLALLTRRPEKSGMPVPVLVSLATWDPEQQDLHAWLIDQLAISHPVLLVPAAGTGQDMSRDGAVSCGQDLLNKRKIFMILDGLDELSEDLRPKAIAGINDALRTREGVVLACRKEEYKSAVGADSAAPVKLRRAAGIVLRHLDPEGVKNYLRAGAVTRAGARRWTPVLEFLGTDTPLGQVFRTPLTVTLAHAIYNPRPGDRAASLPDPAGLCDRHAYPDSESIRDHLLGSFIKAAYRPGRGPKAARPPSAGDAELWLTFLACHLERSNTTQLAWWELVGEAPVSLTPLVVGTICGISAGIAAASGSNSGVGIGIGLGIGTMVGLATGLLPGLAAGLRPGFAAGLLPGLAAGLRPARRSSASGSAGPGAREDGADASLAGESDNDAGPSRGIAGGLAGSAIGGLAAGAAGHLWGFGHTASLISGLPSALGVGLGVGACTSFGRALCGGLIGGFTAGFLEGVGKGTPAGICNGLGIALVVALIVQSVGRDTPAAEREWRPEFGVPGGFTIGAAVALIAGYAEGPKTGLLLGAILGTLSARPIGLRGTKAEQASIPPSPRKALKRDIRVFWTTGLGAGIAAAAFGFLGGGLASVFEEKEKLTFHLLLTDGLAIGLSSGVVVFLAFGVYHSASPAFLLARMWLTLNRQRVPWQLMDFLADAHVERSVLRQCGAHYEFRHVDLQRYLARQEEAKRRDRYNIIGPMPAPYPGALRIRRRAGSSA